VSKITLADGKYGEDVAVTYLKKIGYTILDRNFRLRNGEIDIIAIDKKEQTLVFVEVKTRNSHEFGTPFEAITWWKLQALVRTAEFYKATKKGLPEQMRIDAIAVMLSDDEPHLEHMKSIT
jgi:putative endonuclease